MLESIAPKALTVTSPKDFLDIDVLRFPMFSYVFQWKTLPPCTLQLDVLCLGIGSHRPLCRRDRGHLGSSTSTSTSRLIYEDQRLSEVEVG